jgi:hypothetical protein
MIDMTKKGLKQKFIIFILGLSASVFSNDRESALYLRKYHETGDTLDISIRQELDRAVALGGEWLLRQQSSHGYFGATGDVTETSITLLAVHSMQNKTLPYNGVNKALFWLRNKYPEQAETNAYAALFGVVSLSVFNVFDQISTQHWLKKSNRIIMDSEPDPHLTALQNEFVRSLDKNSAMPGKLSQQLFKPMDYEKLPLLRMWLNARIINRDLNGQLISADGRRVDWRARYARRIISTQKISMRGGGLWQERNGFSDLFNTSLAILICKEL